MTDIEDNSVHCVVTSPPYFGLRRYKGLEDLIFDGGAWRGQLGSELTIEMFIAHLVEVFREVKRVLRPDGVCWVNIGDSMAGIGQGKGSDHGISVLSDDEIGEVRKPTDGLKPLDACLVPFRLALALQADGWWVREDIIWSKNNPMPESLNGWRWEKHKIKVGNHGRYAR